MNQRASVSTFLIVLAVLAFALPVRGQGYYQRFDVRTGHYYIANTTWGAGTWTHWHWVAQGTTRFGRTGFLATIKDLTEQELVREVIYGAYLNDGIVSMWIGGFKTYHLEPKGVWEWVTDQPFTYTYWRPSEPNNHGGREHFLEMFADGLWNDAPDTGPSGGGYAVMEFEPSPVYISSFTGPTSVNSPASVTYTITLSAPAPADGAILYLHSTNPAFSEMPLSVSFNSGLQSKKISFNVGQVSSNRTGTMNVYGKNKKTLGVTVSP